MAQQILAHKQDAKVLLNKKDYGHNRTLYGFETYIREEGIDGKPTKRIIPEVPLAFSPEVTEDGYCYAWLSDTPTNREMLSRAIATGEFSLADESLHSRWYPKTAAALPTAAPAVQAPAQIVKPDTPMTAEDYSRMTKADLIGLVAARGMDPADLKKDALIELLVGQE